MIGIALHNHNSKDIFPPVLASCPDYWIDNASGDGCHPGSVPLGPQTPKAGCGQLPKHKLKKMSNCDKQQWANHCQLTWDGITNNLDLCGRHDHHHHHKLGSGIICHVHMTIDKYNNMEPRMDILVVTCF